MEIARGKELLAEWLRHALEAPRRRQSVEAAVEKSHRLLRLEAGWAFARMGLLERSRRLTAAGFAELNSSDAVERTVAGLYRLRLSEVEDERHPGLRTPGDLEGSIQHLQLFDRYHVMRTFQASCALSPYYSPKPIEAFHEHRPLPWARRLAAVPGVSPPWICERLRGVHDLEDLRQGVLELWPTVSDPYCTNTHWCLTLLSVFSTVAFAIAQAVNPIPLLDSPPAAMS